MDQLTPAEHAANIAAAEARLPVPMRHPVTNRIGLVSPANVQARLDAGWTLVEPSTRPAA